MDLQEKHSEEQKKNLEQHKEMTEKFGNSIEEVQEQINSTSEQNKKLEEENEKYGIVPATLLFEFVFETRSRGWYRLREQLKTMNDYCEKLKNLHSLELQQKDSQLEENQKNIDSLKEMVRYPCCRWNEGIVKYEWAIIVPFRLKNTETFSSK